ncbi:hypothetical protein ACFL3N_01025 [Candidatus Omnitrophota bacterium]
MCKYKIYQKIVTALPMLQIPDRFGMPSWSFLSWNLGICLKSIFSGRRSFDLIFSVSEPVSDHITGLLLKMRTKLPWVAFFSDPWVNNPEAGGHPYLGLQVHKFLQKRVIENADFLIFVTKETRDFVLGQYPSDHLNKCFVIPHSFYPDIDSISPGRPLKDTGRVLFRHIGISTSARTPKPLMAGISIAKKKIRNIESHFQFEFIGRSCFCIRQLRKKYDIGKELIEIPSVNYLESLRRMKGADVLINLDMDSKVNLSLQSKLVEYVGARRPIFGITPKDGASADLIRETNGFLASPDRPEEIADCIIEIVKKKQKGELALHVPGDIIVDRYNVKNEIKEYAKVFEKAASK